jgi:hypothetical protein
MAGSFAIRQSKTILARSCDAAKERRSKLVWRDLLFRVLVALLRFPLHLLLLHLPPSNDEVIVLAVASPRSRRHVADFNKFPISHIRWRQSEIIAHSGRNIQTRAVIGVWFRPFISENILKVIGAERPAVLLFRIASAIALANGEPSVPEHRLSRSRIGLLKPGNHQRRLRLELTLSHVVVRQRTVEGVLFWNESHWNIAAPR